MSYNSVHDISRRLAQQLRLGTRTNVNTVFEILEDLLRACQGRPIESKNVVNSIVKLTPVKSLRVKKMVYLCLSMVTDKDSELWLHVMNSVSNDLFEPNPIIRSSALMLLTDSELVSSSMNDMRLSLIKKSLKDQNNAVRKCGAAGVAKFFRLVSSNKVDLDMSATFEAVQEMIYTDDDPDVIVQCILCLHSSGKGTIEVDLLTSLLERLEMVEVWTKAEVVNLFMQICDPVKLTQEQLFKALNLIDPYLHPRYPLYLSLVCATAMLFVAKRYSAIYKDVKTRVLDFLLSQIALVRSNIQPMFYAMLELISRYSGESKLESHYKRFVPICSDDSYVKIMKLKLLRRSCTKDNCHYLFKVFVTAILFSQEHELIEISMDSMLTLHQFIPEQCEDFILGIVHHDSYVVLTAGVIVLWRLLFSDKMKKVISDDDLNYLVTIFKKIKCLNGKTAVFSILQMFPMQPRANEIADIMTTELTHWDECGSVCYKLNLLRHIVIFYFSSPARFRLLLGEYLFKGSEDEVHFVKKQAISYYKQFKNDVNAVKEYADAIVKLRRRVYGQGKTDDDIGRLMSLCLLTLSEY